MKSYKIKKKVKKVKKSFVQKLIFSKLTKKVKSNFDKTYKKLSNKRKKVKKLK